MKDKPKNAKGDRGADAWKIGDMSAATGAFALKAGLVSATIAAFYM